MSSRPTSRWRALLALLGPDRTRWMLLGLLVAAGSGLALAGPLVVREIIDRASTGTTADDLVGLALLFLLIAVATQATAVLVAWSANVVAWRTTNGLRLRMTRHVLSLDHEFHRRHTPGELIQRVDGDVTSVSDFLGRVVPKAFGAVVLVMGMVVVLSVIDLRVGIGLAVYVAASLAVIVPLRHRAIVESSDELGSYAQLYGGIEERLTAAEDLRANGAADHAMWRFVGDSASALERSVRREHAFLRMWWGVQGSVAAGAVLTLAVSAGLVAGDIITIGTAFLLFQYVLQISRPLEEVVHELETVQKANGAMVRVIDLLAVEPTVLDRGTVSPEPGAMSIEFRDVGFEYADDDEPVLRDVDLAIAAGRSVGVVGRTGSGKTTLSRLVLRLVEATRGEVRLGGVPIADIPMHELRHRVALVPQEVELFAGTVRDNVTLFDPAPSDDDVVSALRQVGLESLADGGIQRPLGAGGAGLSAGEAQLIALARVWLRNPDVVVLDEATARVDPHTEQIIDRAVAELIRGRTTLIIAHRLSTLDRVDEIVVVDGGRIVEHGERSVLASRSGSRFRHLLDLADGIDRPHHDDEVHAVPSAVVVHAAPHGGTP
jgi:ATP-binding cassette, subfamily B, bacterial